MLDAASSPARALRALAFYLPQFHPTPENDVFWGRGFTEWTNVVQARPRFAGHLQPHLPADLGFYDLRLADTRRAQADMARAAGLAGFCWYHYWFHGRRVLHTPFDGMLADPAYDFPFLLCWANENWTRAWDGGPREVILPQSYSDADTVAHARHLAPVFADRRAIRVDGRPAFAVYCSDDLPDTRRWSDLFRATLAREGLAVYLIRVERHLDRDLRPPEALGFDAALDFQPFSRSLQDWQRAGLPLTARISRRWRRRTGRDVLHDMADYVAFDCARPTPGYTRFPGACPSWDNSARRPPGKGIIFDGSSPALFARWLAAKVGSFCPTGDANLFFINAWNEWAEGNHLEPCHHHGHAWLAVLQRQLRETSALT